MPNATQDAWAAELAKARSQSAHRSRTPLSLRKKQTEEEIAHQKEQLARYAGEGNAVATSACLQTLIRLRAKQVAQRVEEEKKKRGGMENETLREEMRRYQRDCAEFKTLLDAV